MSISNITFCSLTMTFINSKWELVSAHLDCAPFSGQHTAETTCVIGSSAKSKSIDNYSTCLLCHRHHSKHEEGRLVMECDWLGCLAHISKLVTGKLLKVDLIS